MKTLVIGLGKSGRAAYDLLIKEGGQVVGTDDKADLLKKLESEGVNVALHPCVEEFDLVVISPGIPPTNPLYVKAIELGKEIIGEAELALSRLHQPCIAITGTNGKTTVTLLVEHVLKTSGLKARALGNVGTPLTSYQGDKQEIMVVELSSFQLELMKTPIVDIGIILNITPDHLDRYTTMEEYALAKCRLQDLMKSPGNFWVHQSVVQDFKHLLKSNYQTYGTDCKCTSWTDRAALYCGRLETLNLDRAKTPGFDDRKRVNISNMDPFTIVESREFSRRSKSNFQADRSIRAGEKIETILPIRYRDLGNHESENVLAAWILCKKFGISSEAFLAGLETFKKPAHRIEFVATLDGVDYFNDSKGTNIDATIKAVEAMTKQVVLIAGGVDKGSSYKPWKKSFTGKVKQVFAIGQAAAKIAEELRPEFEVEIVPTLKDAVEGAKRQAKVGETVLLSPGCSSYDMFQDYAQRGDEFKKFVLRREN